LNAINSQTFGNIWPSIAEPVHPAADRAAPRRDGRSGRLRKKPEGPATGKAPGTGGDGSLTAAVPRKMRLGACLRPRFCGWPLRGNSRDARPPMLHFLFCMLTLNHSSAKSQNGPQQIIENKYGGRLLRQCPDSTVVA